MDFAIIVVALALGVVLFLALLGLTWTVEQTSTEESTGRAVSGSARATH